MNRYEIFKKLVISYNLAVYESQFRENVKIIMSDLLSVISEIAIRDVIFLKYNGDYITQYTYDNINVDLTIIINK